MFRQDTSGERIRAEFGLEGKFVATYSGAIGPANDIPTIIRAAKLLESESQIHIPAHWWRERCHCCDKHDHRVWIDELYVWRNETESRNA